MSIIQTVHDLLLPAKTVAMCDKHLPAMTVRLILLPAKTLGREAETRRQSQQEAIFR